MKFLLAIAYVLRNNYISTNTAFPWIKLSERVQSTKEQKETNERLYFL